MFKRILAVIAAMLIGTVGAVAVAAPAQAAPAEPAIVAGWGAPVVEIESLADLNHTDKIVQVMHLSPFAMKSLSQCAQWTYCLWTSTNFGGSVYAWNTAWNDTCVPIGGSMNNNGESFANKMGPYVPQAQWGATLFSNGTCSTGGFMQSFWAQENDSSLAPWNNIASSFDTFWCNWGGC